MWRSAGRLGSCGSTTRRSSSSPIRLLRPVQIVPLESSKGRSNLNPIVQGLYPWKEGQVYFLTQLKCTIFVQYTRSIKRSSNSGLNKGFLKNETSATQKEI
ncbi:hypothetical protein Taro_029953 [Colocasia esculenta]|uniref:Uncharacterized protein n=1 Tax=Colocasia esculenta TaxID=4460 RepID=A0A843VYQ3_COLES|nr:hypothetical protein [Colocasia esculenta]